MKALVLAMVCGGVGGLALGSSRVPVFSRAVLLAEARAASASDLQTRDLKRALAAVDRLIDADERDLEAVRIRTQLRRQLQCRQAFEGGEHAFANRDFIAAVTSFRDVEGDCDLFEFAQRRLEQIETEWGLTQRTYSAGANLSLMR